MVVSRNSLQPKGPSRFGWRPGHYDSSHMIQMRGSRGLKLLAALFGDSFFFLAIQRHALATAEADAIPWSIWKCPSRLLISSGTVPFPEQFRLLFVGLCFYDIAKDLCLVEQKAELSFDLLGTLLAGRSKASLDTGVFKEWKISLDQTDFIRSGLPLADQYQGPTSASQTLARKDL